MHKAMMHKAGGGGGRNALEVGEVPPPPRGRTAYAQPLSPLAPSASLNSICNRQ